MTSRKINATYEAKPGMKIFLLKTENQCQNREKFMLNNGYKHKPKTKKKYKKYKKK